jgi:folylpolyglutamate synthase/dihydropteroate synthase
LKFKEIKTYPSVKEMLENLSEDSIILGSLFLVGEVKKFLKE